LRKAKPAERLGNLFIFRGTLNLPGQAASEFYWRGINRLYSGTPNEAEAEEAFRRSAELDPTAYFVHIQLGNLYLKSRSLEKCLRAYSEALKYAPGDPKIRTALQNQIQRVSREDLAAVNPLRDPHME
jgi:tetratricopeptide (TPR) repeat protein